jgi:hypothetical protein
MKAHYVPAVLIFDDSRNVSYGSRIRHVKVEHFDCPWVTHRSQLLQCHFALLNRTAPDDNMLRLLGNQE